MTPETSDHDGHGDLADRAAIHDLVVAFYREVVFDDLLAPVFDEVADVDWAEHIPKLIDFWCRVLLGQPGYRGAVLAAHRQVHDLEPLRPEHFDRWYALWVDTIDARWEGPLATLAKDHAARIGASLARSLVDPRSETVALVTRPSLPLNEWTPR
ncbi:MAG: group III truncated hemoglobin [Acidimicrobiales bacterium]